MLSAVDLCATFGGPIGGSFTALETNDIGTEVYVAVDADIFRFDAHKPPPGRSIPWVLAGRNHLRALLGRAGSLHVHRFLRYRTGQRACGSWLEY